MSGRNFGRIFKRSGREGVYVRIRRPGREIVRWGGRTERQAEKKLRKAAALFDDGASVDAVLAEVFGEFTGERVTFREAAPRYLAWAEQHKKASTVHRDRVRLGTIRRAEWAGRYLGEIRPEKIMRWAEGRRRKGASGPTVNRDLAIISALFEWARHLGYCKENPVRSVRRYSEKGRESETYLTAEQARALVETASADFRPLVVCALSTGIRRGELLALTWDAVDFREGSVSVRPEHEKSGRGRVVPMTADLWRTLKGLRKQRKVFSMDGRDPVFVRSNGRPWTPRMVSRALPRTVEACEQISEAMKPKVTFHTLRHTAASLMAQSGVPMFDVGNILGHRDLRMTARYSHFAPKAGRAAVGKLGTALRLGS
jgi:integrase